MQKNLIKSSYLAKKKGLSSSATQHCKTGAYSVRAAGAGWRYARGPWSSSNQTKLS